MKVCKFLWRRALGLLGVSAVLSLACLFFLSAEGQIDDDLNPGTSDNLDRTGATAVAQAVVLMGETLRGLYAPQAGLRSIKVVNEDYLRSSVDSDPNPEAEYNAANDILVSEGDVDSVQDIYDSQDETNREFQAGDFDYESWQAENASESTEVSTPSPTSWTTFPVTGAQVTHRVKIVKNFATPFQPVPRASRPAVTLRTLKNESIVEDGVFWSERVEQLLPQGMSDEKVASFLDRSRRLPVRSVEPPTWNRCGRPKNQFVMLSDGTQACARYRAPHDYLVQGEVMSFYLSRLLGIWNVPAVTLSPVSRWLQWPALNRSLEEAGWASNATVALIQWIDGLERDKMPAVILEALKQGRSLNTHSSQVRNMEDRQLVELVQWSDLLLFDYITGNYDRVASMQDAADREQRPAILEETIHNLVKSRQTQSLWLIDNESGLLDSYSLLYGQGSMEPNQKESRFVKFHKEMLGTMCIFRRETFQRIKWLRNMHTHAAKYLVTFIKKHEPQFKRLPSVFSNREFVTNFHRRIVDVYQHMKRCQVL